MLGYNKSKHSHQKGMKILDFKAKDKLLHMANLVYMSADLRKGSLRHFNYFYAIDIWEMTKMAKNNMLL